MEWLQVYTRAVGIITYPRSALITGSLFLMDVGGDNSGGWLTVKETQASLLWAAFRLDLDCYEYH